MNHFSNLSRSITVLLIEDEPVIRDTLSEILADSGFHILAAADGELGCELFDQKCDEIDFVILDLTLPKRSGIEVLEYIENKRDDVPVMVCSGSVETADIKKMVDDGRIFFIAKPFQFEEVISLIRSTVKL